MAASVRRHWPLLGLLLLCACGHRTPDALMLIEVHEEQCAPEACVQAATRLKKLLSVQLAARNCSHVQVLLSRDQWMLANTPPKAKHWDLMVTESLGPGPHQLSWLLSGPGTSTRGAGTASQTVKAVCAAAN